MAFVMTAGQLKAVQSPANRYGGPIPSYVAFGPTLSLTYEQIWRSQPAVRTVVGFLARNVAQLGVDPFRKVSPTDRVKLSDHPLARLLERPYPGTKWTKYRLLSTVMHELCIFDDAYLLKLRLDGGDVRAIVPIPHRMISPVGDNWFLPEQYELRGSTGTRYVDPNEVVHIHGYNPNDPRRGVAPIETLRQILAEEHAATSYREQLWRNGARVAGYLKRPKDAPRWSDPARSRFKADWQAQYTGDGLASGGTPILEDGMEFMSSGVSPKDAQYVEARKLTREEVASAYHVSPSMVGILEGANFSSIQELHRMLYQDTLPPYLTQIAQDLENQLLEDVDPSAADGSVYVEFNLAEKLRGSFEEQTQALQSAVGGPWMTRAEARAMFNMAEVEGSDELIVPLNVITGGIASPRDTAPDQPDNGRKSYDTVLRKFYARQRQAVLSKVGANGFVPVDLFDAARWNRELSDDMRKAGWAISAPALDAWVERTNGDTQRRLAFATAEHDPKAGVRRVFDELMLECE